MALREIITEGEPLLRRKSREVTAFDEKLGELLDDMAQTMAKADGVGLAAPQVSILRRIVVIDVGDEHGLIELVNPEIVSVKGKQTSKEGCLSCPGQWGYVDRPAKVKVRAKDRHGKEFEITGEELLAVALCHEIDHLDGVLFIDKAKELFNERQD